MSQQAKDIYSGIKKIFPSSSRSGSFSLASRMSVTGLDTALEAEAQTVARNKVPRQKKVDLVFPFRVGKTNTEQRRVPPIVMSLPYGATAATPKADKSSEDSDKGSRSSLTQTLNNALHSTPLRSSLFGKPSNKTTRTEPRSRQKEKKETEEKERLEAKLSTEVRPHASTWDSDSDDDYEDTKRPTLGLERRSNSMDFMEQAPTHLIAKIWRKLPIQARLIGGRGNVDLDLQKDRTSFSRSFEARKFALAAEKAKAAELHRRSLSNPKELSPGPVDEVLAPGVAKHTRFDLKLTIIASDANDGAPGAYTAVESYDDVLVRVCKFAAQDQRPTTTKVLEFLERSMAFLHCTRTKHGNVVNISNGEIRMWRRLALHDWTLEEVTTTEAAAALGVKGKDVEAPRNHSVATESTDSDSDSQQLRGRRRLRSTTLHRSLSASAVEEEPEMEGDEDEELEVPSNMKFAKLCDVINCCVNFGEVQFTPDEVNDLVRLKFIVEEDGWI
ncbi:unnamed protein product [Peronospora destructor]|uniref:Protein kinase domain-containing protein n=1 Tax=Peronospora destructor TaxID=86335 RepID=A0AAV0V754_9STRA|nr:unnamed protein product [Peronospora destructor]